MKILGLGPYIGSWEEELLNFYPYMNWISNIVQYDEIYISTHINRSFLYDWIPSKNMLNVFENLSRDEFSQIGSTNSNISNGDFQLIYKKFKNDVLKYSDTNKKNIEFYNIQYSQQNNFYPYHNKIYKRINIDTKKVDKLNYIVYIPDIRENIKIISEIYNQLIKKYNNIIVIGDLKTHLSSQNVILKNNDYFQNGYKYIIEYINNAKAVICPLGHWSLLCNIQKIPVFTWGTPLGLYGGEYYKLTNRNCKNFLYDSKMTSSKLIDLFDFFMEKIK